MTIYDRRQSLLDLLQKQPGLTVPELGAALGVLQGTIRNDLNALEQESLLKRVHGGAILTDDDQFQNRPFLLRYKEHAADKLAIARAAAGLVLNGDSIFLDASSTAYYLARCLSDTYMGQGKFPGILIPFSVALFIVFAIIFGLVLHKATFGRYLFAIGNNENASLFSGTQVAKVKIICFTLSGFIAALAGLVLAARFGSTRLGIGTGQGERANKLVNAFPFLRGGT